MIDQYDRKFLRGLDPMGSVHGLFDLNKANELEALGYLRYLDGCMDGSRGYELTNLGRLVAYAEPIADPEKWMRETIEAVAAEMNGSSSYTNDYARSHHIKLAAKAAFLMAERLIALLSVSASTPQLAISETFWPAQLRK